MKKRKLFVSIITILACIIVLSLWLIWPNDFFNSISVNSYDVDLSEEITLNFENATVKINEWGKDYVEIAYDNILGGKKEFVVINNNNILTLNTELAFSGFKHFTINVPKNLIVNINTDRIDADSGTFRRITCNNGAFRYCSFVDGFVSEGKYIEIRESDFSGASTLCNQTIKLRECDVNQLVLNSKIDKGTDIEVREVYGNSVTLTGEGTEPMLLIRDSSFDVFVITSEISKGDITILSGNIKTVDNKSNIEIEEKDNFIN